MAVDKEARAYRESTHTIISATFPLILCVMSMLITAGICPRKADRHIKMHASRNEETRLYVIMQQVGIITNKNNISWRSPG